MATNQEMHSSTYVTVAENLDAKVSGVPTAVANVKIRRNGKEVSWLQDTADTNTMVRALTAQVTALTGLVSQLSTGQEIDYERINTGVRDILATEVVKVDFDMTVNGGAV